MKILKTFFILIFTTVSIISCAQNGNKEIENQFIGFTNDFINKNYDSYLKKMNQTFFEKIKKEDFVAMMKSSYENPMFSIKSEPVIIKSISNIEKIEDNYYAEISYSSNIDFELDDNLSEEQKKTLNQKFLESFNLVYGEKNVKNVKVGKIEIVAHKKAIANSNNNKDWYFLIMEKRYYESVKDFYPKEIIDKYKE
jgi:hypothetical protein